MTVSLSEVVSYLDKTLEIGRFRDYAPNGLQVDGAERIGRVATAVSANMAVFERAVDADLLIVHHGLFWGAGVSRMVGSIATRLRFLFKHHIALAAYHLPLDAHSSLGNNAGLADAIGLEPSSLENFGDVRGHALGLAGQFETSLSRQEAIAHIGQAIGGKEPRFVFAHGPTMVRKVGLCTGAASDLLEDAAHTGCDVFITGELAERAGELAAELGITLVAAGHVATEVYGPQRLATHLKTIFPSLDTEFIHVPSPL